jgi:chorismate mutase
MGWEYVPLICGHEMNVPTGLPLCIRVMIMVNTEKRPEEMAHLYLRDAKNLRSTGIN